MEVVMDGKIAPMFEKHLGTEYDVTSNVKPSVRLAIVALGLGEPGNDFTKQYQKAVGQETA